MNVQTGMLHAGVPPFVWPLDKLKIGLQPAQLLYLAKILTFSSVMTAS
jgi:hypothetical protein